MSEFVKRYHAQWKKDRSDLEYQEYLSERVFDTIDTLFRKIIKKQFGGNLLDVGCGEGAFVRCCNKKGLNAVGIDINNGCNFETDKLPYPDSGFDIIFMYSLLEHLHDPDNLMREIKRVSKAKGLAVIITPEWRYSFRTFYEDPLHVHPHTSKSLELLMKMYQFKKLFLGLWTVKKSYLIWKLPERLQFLYGKLLPFRMGNKYIPNFLKGKSVTILACFENQK